jgi:prephenate dehydrogenase
MDSAAHDEAVASTSHAPHLVASLLAARFSDAPAEVTRVAGRGLRDVLRIAGGDPGLWTDILLANAEPVLRVLTELHGDLASLLDALGGQERGEKYLTDLLHRGVSGRETIENCEPAARQGR